MPERVHADKQRGPPNPIYHVANHILFWKA